ncbi:hypothetical protein [Sphingomicrobium aestuariivivum]|uniref:hypothetical protein n=1 Tax=Sphingomicrobium aestuariivivum TaxID=1582356 RepID=UPI001FD6EAF9|nr:hypothetical protein [Sphingomicrobium aestuariivivum]MCJ8189919.1 hypothetical protein [Sphingomicrobium aestuariivivum]
MLLAACDPSPMVTEIGEPTDVCLPNLAESSIPLDQDVAVEVLLRFEESETAARTWLEERGQPAQAFVVHQGADPALALENFKAATHEKLPVIFGADNFDAARIDLGVMPFGEVRPRVCPLLVEGIKLDTIALKPRVQTPESN